MPYLRQPDAHIFKARQYLADAREQSSNWPFCGSLLARALEHGVCAVFIAWGEPYKAGKKIQRHFDERLMPWIEADLAAFARLVWHYEGGGQPFSNVLQLVTACEGAVQRFDDAAANEPPPGWSPLPVPPPIDWEALTTGQQVFLGQALTDASYWCPEIRIMLFGSRAAGTARDDSDYDLLFIFPDDTDQPRHRATTSAVGSLAYCKKIEVDIERVTTSEWANPSSVNEIFINRVKQCSIEIRR